MKKNWFSAVVAQQGDNRTAQVDIRGYIGDWGVNDADFVNAVESFGDVGEIHVAINSRGGQVDHGLSIFNYLRNHPAKVTVRVDGVAMSAASMIAMAGDHIIMPANAIMMVHQPSGIVMGTSADMQKAAEDLKVFESALLETYIARTGRTAEDLTAMLDAETFMTASQAVEQGFADVVEPLARQSASSAMAVYANAIDIPADVLERAAAEGAQSQGEPEPKTEAPKTETPPEPVAQFAPLEASLPARIAEAANAAGLGDYVAWFVTDCNLQDVPSAQAALADANTLVELCALAGKPERAPTMIRARTPLADARRALATELAVEDEARQTDSNPNPALTEPAAAKSATSIWEARRARQTRTA